MLKYALMDNTNMMVNDEEYASGKATETMHDEIIKVGDGGLTPT